MTVLSDAEEKQILEGSGFKTRTEVAQELAILRKRSVRYRADEGMPPESEVQAFQGLLSRVENLAKKLGITEEEVHRAGPEAESRIAQTKQRVEMIERVARALAAGGWNHLMESEQEVMASDPEFERAVLARA